MAPRLHICSSAMLHKQVSRLLAAATVVVSAALPLEAAARLTYTIGDKAIPVVWPASAFPIPYRVDGRVMAALPNAAAVLDRAFAAWATAPDTSVSFRSLGVANGLKAGHDGQNTITLADDLFKDQYAIAMTTNWYDSS